MWKGGSFGFDAVLLLVALVGFAVAVVVFVVAVVVVFGVAVVIAVAVLLHLPV